MPSESEGPSLTALVSDFERAVLRGDATFDVAIAVIDGLKTFGESGGVLERGNPELVAVHWYTRLAAALTTCFTNYVKAITADQLDALCKRKQDLVYLFNASGYRNTRHFITLMSKPTNDGLNIDRRQAVVLLALLGLDDLTDDLVALALSQPPPVLFKLMLGWLTQRAVLTRRGEQYREKLIQSAELMESVEIEDKDIKFIAQAWMYCSYADSPTKHNVKRVFNKLLARRMAVAGIAPIVASKQRSKPLMLIPLERFHSNHAMYRCWAPYIRDLRRYFDLVAMVRKEDIDKPGQQEFDRVITIPPEMSLATIVKSAQEVEPNFIFYPSIGMSHWTIMMAGLRIAPIQVMAHGHPATSMWPTIDYAYVNRLEGAIDTIHSEKLLVGNNTAVFAPHGDLAKDLPSLRPASEREVRIAVNSKVMKLSYRLIEICKRLTAEAPVPVRFTFFPGERHSYFDGLVAALRSQLPEADIMPYCNYQDFIEALAKCDFALAAFPFGNTNSTVDTCLMGIPTVAHFGLESPAQSDRLVLQTAGMPDWLVCDSDEVYFDTAMKLISEPELRASVTNHSTREQIRQRFFEDEINRTRNPFADVLHHVYQRHAELESSGQKVFYYEELLG